jgi:hypothetical protein
MQGRTLLEGGGGVGGSQRLAQRCRRDDLAR